MMLVALVLAASCTKGAPEGRHSDVVAEKPNRAKGCWAKLDALAAKGWDAARKQMHDADASPCLGEARDALDRFKDEAELRAWLKEHELLDGVPADAKIVSVRHALHFGGHTVAVALEQSAEPPLRPVDGMGAIAALAPELKGAKLLDAMPPPTGCSLTQKTPCKVDCYATVPLMISLKDKCLTRDVKTLVCSGEEMTPYVLEQVQLLNQAVDPSHVFLTIEKGALVVFGPKAGLKAAQDEKLLRGD
jgi:hypothetical protein